MACHADVKFRCIATDIVTKSMQRVNNILDSTLYRRIIEIELKMFLNVKRLNRNKIIADSIPVPLLFFVSQERRSTSRRGDSYSVRRRATGYDISVVSECRRRHSVSVLTRRSKQQQQQST